MSIDFNFNHISHLIESFKPDAKPTENVEIGQEDEYLDDLPYFLGNIAKDDILKLLKEIKQVE